MWNEMFVAQFHILSRNLPEGLKGATTASVTKSWRHAKTRVRALVKTKQECDTL
jgi:hypothetical protein